MDENPYRKIVTSVAKVSKILVKIICKVEVYLVTKVSDEGQAKSKVLVDSHPGWLYPPQFLAEQLTLSQPGGRLCSPQYNKPPPP